MAFQTAFHGFTVITYDIDAEAIGQAEARFTTFGTADRLFKRLLFLPDCTPNTAEQRQNNGAQSIPVALLCGPPER